MRTHRRIAFIPGVVIHPATLAASSSTDLLGLLASGRGTDDPARLSIPHMVHPVPATPRFAAGIVFPGRTADDLAPRPAALHRVAGEADARRPVSLNRVDLGIMSRSGGIVSAQGRRAAPRGEADAPCSAAAGWSNSEWRTLSAWLGRVSGHVARDRTTSAMARPAGAAREFTVFQR